MIVQCHPESLPRRITVAEAGLSCLHLPLSHFRRGRGTVVALLREDQERSVAAQQCELRDRGAGGLRGMGRTRMRSIIFSPRPAPINDKGAKPLYICAAVHPGRREAGEETLNERPGAVVNCGPVFCQTKS